MTSGGIARPQRAQLGNRDLEFSQQLEEKPFELLVGAIDLVDEEDCRTRAFRIDRLQQRPLDQKRIAVKLAMRAGAIERLGCVEDSQLEQLTRVIPFVQRVTDVEAFVALKTDEIGVERRGGRGGERSLADARLTFEKERPFQPQRQEQRDRQPAIGDVLLGGQALLEFGNGFGKNGDASDGTGAAV